MSEHADELVVRKIPPTARPNGSLCQPRNPLRVQSVAWNDDGWVVLVYGTHDADLAREIAQAEWAVEQEGPLPEPQRIWTKKVPWDAFGYGWDNTIMEVSGDLKGSTPTLQYGAIS